MKRMVLLVLGVAALSAGAIAQSPAELDKALAPAPRNLKEGATVIKLKADGTYDTLRKGTNRLVCYDRSGTARPAAVRGAVHQHRQPAPRRPEHEVRGDDRQGRKAAAIDAAEKDGSRAKPEFGSVWYTMNGADQATARNHVTIAVPGATTASMGLPSDNKQGGVWIMNAGTSTAHLMTPGS